MKWISIKDRLPDPTKEEFIVAIMKGRWEQGGDPFKDALIVFLRDCADEWRSMDSTTGYYLPKKDGEELDVYQNWENTIEYWIPWHEFSFPESMLRKKNELG